jgi:tetratricopeptide (TPR) repeat protein
MLFANK